MVTMETTTQRDYLLENADNIWFVLGAYFFAFFPWAIMNNVDFISEKWRTCRRTRQLARIHLASNILPIIYVAVYAEAQRRDEDYKELGAALAALMFNIFQLLRTIMGWVQLNAFVAWCKHAVECMEALVGDDYQSSSSSSESLEGGGRDKTRRILGIVGQWRKEFVLKCKRGSHLIRMLLRRDGDNAEQHKNRHRENRESSVNVNVDGNDVDGAEEDIGSLPVIIEEKRNPDADADSNVEESGQSVERNSESRDDGNESNAENKASLKKVDDGNWIEDKIMVNNMVVDNELGGREVTVLPSLEKIWGEVKKGRFTPSTWLRTDRVILNTVRWGGAYLCGMGRGWSVDPYHDYIRRQSGEVLESFFSKEMYRLRSILQKVEWDMNMENDGREFLAINATGSSDIVQLTGEMSTAYGNRLARYDVEDTYTVDAYSFEFASLVGSYPSGGKMYRTANREKIVVGLVHSVLLAKHLGVEKLRVIRRYYDEYRLPEGDVTRNAFKLLLKQTDTHILDDAKIWTIFNSSGYDIPIFPYRMQMVALWDEGTNWRVCQASAHQDIISRYCYHLIYLQDQNEKWILHNAPDPVNIFDYCAKWTTERINRSNDEDKGSLGVVVETVRTFLAEWVTASTREANWEPVIPTGCVEFNTGAIAGDEDYLIWVCQRELQGKVAKMSREEDNFPGNAALIMLFILGFPLLKMDDLQEAEVHAQDSVQEGRGSSPSNSHRIIDLSVEVWRAWTPLAPQHISLVIQIDKKNRTASLRLENNSGDTRFIWQNWVDAAMGCMKGFEEGKNGKCGYGRKIVRANLRKPMVEMCPLLMDGDGIENIVARKSTARIWMGWPPFEVGICKFEVDQWLDACDLNIRRGWQADQEVARVSGIINAVISEYSLE